MPDITRRHIHEALFEQNRDGVFCSDLNGRFTDVNAAAARLSGYTTTELLQMSWRQLCAPDAVDKTRQHLRPPTPGTAADFETALIRKDGKRLTLLTTGGPIATGDQTRGFFAIVRDITKEKETDAQLRRLDAELEQRIAERLAELRAINERLRREAGDRRRAEQEARQSEARYRLLIEHAPSITYSAALDEIASTLYISPQVERLLGLTVEQCQQDRETWQKHVHPDDRERVLAEVARCRATGAPLQCEYRMLTHDGRVVWFRDHAVIVPDDDGGPATFEGVMLDITGQKETEAALRESEELYRRLFDNEPNAVITFDAETRRFIDANPAALQLYGYSRGELLGLRHSDITTEPQASDESIRSTVAGRLDHIPLRYHRKKDGTVFPVEINACTFQLGGRQVVCGILRDITQRRRAEEAIQQYQEQLQSLAFQLVLTEDRQRRQLAAELHDGPGQAITLARIKLQMLSESSGNTPAAQALAEIDQLVADADASLRSLTVEISPPVLHELGFVPGVEWLAEQMREQYGLTVRVDHDGRCTSVPEEAALVLFRAVRELVINVAKHADTDEADITMRREGADLQITVADRGRGFDARTDVRPSSTAGFGLFGVREQLDRLQGRTQIQSQAGTGTVVTLSVPIVPTDEQGSGRSR